MEDDQGQIHTHTHTTHPHTHTHTYTHTHTHTLSLIWCFVSAVVECKRRWKTIRTDTSARGGCVCCGGKKAVGACISGRTEKACRFWTLTSERKRLGDSRTSLWTIQRRRLQARPGHSHELESKRPLKPAVHRQTSDPAAADRSASGTEAAARSDRHQRPRRHDGERQGEGLRRGRAVSPELRPGPQKTDAAKRAAVKMQIQQIMFDAEFKEQL